MIHYNTVADKHIHVDRVKNELSAMKKNVVAYQTLLDLKASLEKQSSSVTFLGQASSYDLYEMCQEIAYLFPLTVVILLVNKEDIDYKRAMHSGAVEIVDVNNPEELKSGIRKAEEILNFKIKQVTKEEEKEGKVITVCSTKGGVGKTTICVNAAVSYSKKNLKVAVIDLDLQFGDVSLLFDQKPKQTIYEWMKENDSAGPKPIETYLAVHSSGIHILPSPHLPELAELVTGDHVNTIIQEMKKKFDVILIDTPPSFVETSLVALDNSDEILLITSLDLPALKNGKLAVQTLGLLGFSEKIKVVLNRDSEKGDMTLEMAEQVLGLKIEYRIPSDYHLVISSVNKGIPFVIMAPRSPVAKAVLKFAEGHPIKKTIQKDPVQKVKKTHWLAKLGKNGGR
jgi:pilus assembly protein CpaE